MANLDILSACLFRGASEEETSVLRRRLFSNVVAWEQLFALAIHFRIMPILASRLRERALIPPSVASSDPKRLPPAAILDAQWKLHTANRVRQECVLGEIVSIINRLGTEPVLLKGARSLWCSTEPWRAMRDLDILVPAQLAHDVYQALIEAGFVASQERASLPGKNHLAPLFRTDLPGWLEVHVEASGRYAEPFLPTAEIVKRSTRYSRGQRRALVLKITDHIYHGLIHHHFGHRGFRTGSIDIKGLFEFSEGIAALTQKEIEDLSHLTRQNSAGLAAFELWLAAATDFFGATLTADTPLPPDAQASWERIKMRLKREKHVPWYLGYFETVKLATNSDRIRRVLPHRAASWTKTMLAIERLMPLRRLD
jgi:hypothetical protein